MGDIFAISSRAKISSRFFTADKRFVSLLSQILSNRRAPAQLHLECVMFVSSVTLYSEPAKILGASIVAGIVNVFTWYTEDLDIQTQCMFAFYRFICHSDSRSALLNSPSVINGVIEHSASQNAVVNSMANAVLEVLVCFEKEWSERIKRPRFLAFNQEWLRALNT
jgi:hypothetical protein